MQTNINDQIYEFLTSSKIIDKKVLDSCVNESKLKEKSLTEILLLKDLISDTDLGKITADILSLPFVRLSEVSIPEDVLKIVPEIVAKNQKIIVFKLDKKGVHLATSSPSKNESIEFVGKKLGIPVVTYFATEKDIVSSLSLYSKNIKEVFEEIINAKTVLSKEETEPQIIKIVDTLISYAYKNKASDIHIEPLEENLTIRFRIDGILHDVVYLPTSFLAPLVTRVKVMAKLRTDEHQMAQDGKIRTNLEDEDLDIRVSIAPTVKGEKIVLRLLSEKSRQFSLHDLGFPDSDLPKIENAYKRPFGMILSTGPTGCGKTTTMYAILKILNQREVNIMTIEDPVEYDVEGVNQIQVNTKTGLTFANGLKSIIRQDPNVILVGEIRDDETAGIAVNSAMTGHLVLSTMHTNDAVTAIPRLMDMGVEPFLISSSVNIIIGQRLVRKICMQCRISKEIETSSLSKYFSNDLIKKIFGDKKALRVYEGKGCDICHDTGYLDRVSIFEVMEMTDNMRGAITKKSDAGELLSTAIKDGMKTMVEDGLDKVLRGITTVEEVVRVTKE